MMKIWLYAIFALPIILLLLLFNIRLHSPGDLDMVISQLEFLEESLQEGGGEQMQQAFPEGYVFTWALYGIASAQVARQLPPNDSRIASLLERTRVAIERVGSPQARTPFPETLDLPYGAFYNSWSLYLRAEYCRAAGVGNVSPELLAGFESDCALFTDALGRSTTPFLESYSGKAWPADASVGIAALAIHDRILQPKYETVITRWIAEARRRLDRSLQALGHAADHKTGEPEPARGSSLALMSRVLVEADPDFAREQYAVLRSHFVDYTWGVPGVREYPIGTDGMGDIDSGPLLFGYSGPAIVVGAAAARVHGDESLAGILLGAIEVAGFPLDWGNGRRYLAGALPVGDAFIAWARSSPPPGDAVTWERAIPIWWALPWHAVSAALALLLALPMIRPLRSRWPSGS